MSRRKRNEAISIISKARKKEKKIGEGRKQVRKDITRNGLRV